MTGWKKQYDGKFWMDPLFEELVVLDSQRLAKKISGKESNYVAEFIGRGKKKEFVVFRHDAGAIEDAEYYYDLYTKKDFIGKIRRLFLQYKKKEYKLRLKYLFGKETKERLTYNVAKKYFMEGYVLSKFTDPPMLFKIENEIKSILEKKLGGDKSILLEMDSHHEPNIFSREEKDVFELALLMKQKKPYKDKLSYTWHEYGLLKYVRRNKPLPKQYFVKKAKENISLTEKELLRKIALASNMESSNAAKRNALFKKHHFTPEEKRLIEIHAEVAHIRLELRALWIPYYCNLHSILKRMALKKGMKRNALVHLSGKQLGAYFKTGKLPKNPHHTAVLLYKEKDKSYIYYNSEALKKVKQFEIPLTLKHSDKVKGEIANSGYIEGKVRVLNWDLNYVKNMKEVKQGEILVVTQTKPDMMEAIRKAAGIITNEGGMISHAAIISRELGIPCLMGTGYATEYFKTGDNVVLDCKKGEAYKK